MLVCVNVSKYLDHGQVKSRTNVNQFETGRVYEASQLCLVGQVLQLSLAFCQSYASFFTDKKSLYSHQNIYFNISETSAGITLNLKMYKMGQKQVHKVKFHNSLLHLGIVMPFFM